MAVLQLGSAQQLHVELFQLQYLLLFAGGARCLRCSGCSLVRLLREQRWMARLASFLQAASSTMQTSATTPQRQRSATCLRTCTTGR